MIKLLCKAASVLACVPGGTPAGVIFKQIWQLAAQEDDAAKLTDAGRCWPEVLAAAALQGAVYAVVRAATGRGAAAGTRKLAGLWPGGNGEQATGAA